MVYCSEIHLLCQIVQGYFPLSPLIRFSVSGFTLRSLIHLGLSSVQGDKYRSICTIHPSSLTSIIGGKCWGFFQCVLHLNKLFSKVCLLLPCHVKCISCHPYYPLKAVTSRVMGTCLSESSACCTKMRTWVCIPSIQRKVDVPDVANLHLLFYQWEEEVRESRELTSYPVQWTPVSMRDPISKNNMESNKGTVCKTGTHVCTHKCIHPCIYRFICTCCPSKQSYLSHVKSFFLKVIFPSSNKEPEFLRHSNKTF